MEEDWMHLSKDTAFGAEPLPSFGMG
jgi:hypothetical protein